MILVELANKVWYKSNLSCFNHLVMCSFLLHVQRTLLRLGVMHVLIKGEGKTGASEAGSCYDSGDRAQRYSSFL